MGITLIGLLIGLPVGLGQIVENKCNSKLNICDEKSTVCVNNQDDITCQCLHGYQKHNSTTCTDIDECETKTANCDKINSICTNQPGGFECKCKDQFEGNGVICERVQEKEATVDTENETSEKENTETEKEKKKKNPRKKKKKKKKKK